MSSYTIPSVVEKTVRGERAVDIYSRLLTDRIVYLGTEIDDGVANVVIAQLLHLESESPESPIDLYLNSPGGSMTAMLAVYDTMQFISSPVATTASARPARRPPCSWPRGEAGRRQVLPHGRVVLHQPSGGARARCPTWCCTPGRSSGCAPRWRRSWPGTPAATVERIREDTDRDLVLSAQEAVDYGLADAILDSRKLLLARP